MNWTVNINRQQSLPATSPTPQNEIERHLQMAADEEVSFLYRLMLQAAHPCRPQGPIHYENADAGAEAVFGFVLPSSEYTAVAITNGFRGGDSIFAIRSTPEEVIESLHRAFPSVQIRLTPFQKGKPYFILSIARGSLSTLGASS